MSSPMNSDPASVMLTEKHIGLDDAIKEIQELRQHTNDVLLRITGNNQPEPPVQMNEKQPHPTLQNVLIEGPDRIRRTCSEVHKVLDEITQTLF